MIASDEAALVEVVLREEFPELCRMVGRANTRDVARTGGAIRLVPLNGASKLDLAGPMALLAAAAAIVSHGLTIAKTLREMKSKEDPSIALQVKLELPQDLRSKLDSETIEKLVQKLIARL